MVQITNLNVPTFLKIQAKMWQWFHKSGNMFFKIPQVLSQKWIVVGPNNDWSVFHRKVLFLCKGPIKWQRCADHWERGIRWADVAWWCVSEGHLDRERLGSCDCWWLLEKIAFMNEVWIYYNALKEKWNWLTAATAHSDRHGKEVSFVRAWTSQPKLADL